MASSPSLIPKTVAFNTKTGDWNTRYSFLPDCYSFLNKLFFSTVTTLTSNISWLHNSDRVRRTSYYGSVEGSGISIAFNDNVSNNKIYKAFSLEGTNNINGANAFIVNSDNLPNKNYSIGELKDKGGILYGHVGQSVSMLAGGNLELVGLIDSVDYSGGADFMRLEITTTENDLLPSHPDSLYIVGDIVDGSIVFESFFGELESSINSNFVEFTENDLQNVARNFDGSAVQQLEGSYTRLLTLDDFTGFSPSSIEGKLLFEVNPSNIYGDAPRGQYAEAVVSLGSAPYELYSLNIDYEPTNLDHSGQ